MYKNIRFIPIIVKKSKNIKKNCHNKKMSELVNINIFDSDEDSDDCNELIIRKQYVLKMKPDNFKIWDDTEFFQRFRLKKGTVLHLLAFIEHQLLIHWNK